MVYTAAGWPNLLGFSFFRLVHFGGSSLLISLHAWLFMSGSSHDF